MTVGSDDASETPGAERGNAGNNAVHSQAPESMMAAWKRPRLSGATMCSETDVAPALSPKIVTRSGSPPNAPIDFLTLPETTLRLPDDVNSRWPLQPCLLLIADLCDGAGMAAGMAYHCSARVWSWMP